MVYLPANTYTMLCGYPEKKGKQPPQYCSSQFLLNVLNCVRCLTRVDVLGDHFYFAHMKAMHHTRQQANTAITSKLKNNQVRSNCGATIMESFAIESRRHVCAEILSHCNDPVVPFKLNYAVERSWFWCGRNAEKEKASRTQQRFAFDGTGWAGHVGMLMWYRLSIFYYIAEAKGPKTKVFPENTCSGCWLLPVWRTGPFCRFLSSTHCLSRKEKYHHGTFNGDFIRSQG